MAPTLLLAALGVGDPVGVWPVEEVPAVPPAGGGAKLVFFGWHSPTPEQLRDDPAGWAATPFDGFGLKLADAAGGGYVLDPARWDGEAFGEPARAEAARERAAAALRDLAGRPVAGDSFLTVHGTSTVGWFDDGGWAAALGRLRWCARAAKAGGLKGVLWDPEPYGPNKIWAYRRQPGAGGRAFAEYYDAARRRGAEFTRAIRGEFPDAVILSLRQLSDFQRGSPFSQGLLPVTDPAAASAASAASAGLAGGYWGLHAAFTNGMLEAMRGSGLTLIDGNEDAYYYTSAGEYDAARRTILADALALVDPAVRDVYRARVRAGHAVSVDYPFGNWAAGIGFPRYLKAQGTKLPVERRAAWLGHNTYHALRASGGYAWVYAEDMDWRTGENVPPGAAEAIREAKRLAAAGLPPAPEYQTVPGDLAAARAALRAAHGDAR